MHKFDIYYRCYYNSNKPIEEFNLIKNMDDFPIINEVYAEFFKHNDPARACVEVARLPRDANFEIEAIGLL